MGGDSKLKGVKENLDKSRPNSSQRMNGRAKVKLAAGQ
jgi:hypothetical protein